MKILLPIAIFTLALSACSKQVRNEQIYGPYIATAVDIPGQAGISYKLEDGSSLRRIEPNVFAYGFDQQYIVAKQHPNNDQSKTNYFYLTIAKDQKYVDPSISVTGPLSSSDFEKAKMEKGLPDFAKTLQ